MILVSLCMNALCVDRRTVRESMFSTMWKVYISPTVLSTLANIVRLSFIPRMPEMFMFQEIIRMWINIKIYQAVLSLKSELNTNVHSFLISRRWAWQKHSPWIYQEGDHKWKICVCLHNVWKIKCPETESYEPCGECSLS